MSDPINEVVERDPANDGSLGGVLKGIFKKVLQGIEGQLPATVISYNRVTNLAVIQPQIHVLATSGATVQRGQLAAIPVLALGGGGFCITFPLKAGDTGWIEASDRDISLYMQNSSAAPPNTDRLHSFSDGRFIPDAFAKYTFSGDDEADMVIQSFDGQTKIALGADHVNIKSTNVKVTGNFEVTGTSLLTGPVTAPAGATIAEIPFDSHKHPGVMTGPNETGGPTA